MLLGKVKWFDNNKGYGFILPLEECELENGEVFIHHERIKKNGFKTLKENQLVKYEKTETENGIMAEIVIPIELNATETMESMIVDLVSSFFIDYDGEDLSKLVYGASQIIIHRKMRDASVKMDKNEIEKTITWESLNDILKDRKFPLKVRKGVEIYLTEIDFNEDAHQDIINLMKNNK